jgi:hypothetical protein
MIDISGSLSAASTRSWSTDLAAGALRWLSQNIDGSAVDWDQGSGEEWGRIVVGSRLVALVCARVPLVILADGASTASPDGVPGGPVALIVPSMDSACLSVSPDILEAVFGRSVSRELAYDAVSAEDLAWATI